MFHEKCDSHGPTVSILKSNFGGIFGGYTVVPWTNKGNNVIDNKSFICSFSNNRCFYAEHN